MKKYSLISSFLLLSSFLFSFTFAQDKSQEKNVVITYTWSRIKSFGSNQIAVWIEDIKGNHICTLFATNYTAKGGYAKRSVSLSEWVSKFDLKNVPKEEVDAISGATPKSGKQTLTWNCKDKSGKITPAGTYVVRMEANIKNADKMFFKGEIKIGGNAQQAKGETTFSKPDLASGNVLIKDVLVEYK